MSLKKMLLFVKDSLPGCTCGVLTVLSFSCALFGIQTYFDLTEGLLSVGASVLQRGHLHRLLLYPLSHRSLPQLLLSSAALALLSGSLERGVGTVRFLCAFLLLSVTTGLLYSLLDLLQGGDSGGGHTEGSLPAALSCVALTTMHTKMTKGFLCGVSFPTVALPWVLLILTTVLVPHSVLPCNIIAVLVGWTHGRGWFSLLDVSESRAAALEKTVVFRVMRNLSGGLFVVASAEERRQSLLPRINPTPGSYPVQAYAPVSSVKAADSRMYEGWLNSESPGPPPHSHGSTLSFGLNHGHSCNHGHAHGHAHSHGQM